MSFLERFCFALASVIPPILHTHLHVQAALNTKKQRATPVDFPTEKTFVCLLLGRQPPVGHGLLIHDASISHKTTHHSRQDSDGRVISSPQRPLPDNTQHSQTSMPPSGIQTHNPSRQAAADLHLRQLGHWDRPSEKIRFQKSGAARNGSKKHPLIFQALNG